MSFPRLYPILDSTSLTVRNFDLVTAVEAALDGGAQILQLRHKGHYSRPVFEQAARAAELCRVAGATFIVNDRADIARLLGAGLHVGQDDLPPAEARRLIGPGRILGLSTHNAEQFAAAAREPVDYLAIGPIFETRSKVNPDPVVGTAGLKALARGGVPLVAIGGITRANALEVFAAGADSVAVIHDILPNDCTYEGLRQRIEEWQRLAKSRLGPAC